MEKLTGLKNTFWAAGILVSLLALLVGLLLAMSSPCEEERLSGTLVLGEKNPRKAEQSSVAGAVPTTPTLLELPASAKGGLDNVFGMTFLCDKTLLGLRTYSQNYADGVTTAFWTDSGVGLPAAVAASTPIQFVDGSQITPVNAAMISKPKKLVIYLGGDELADTTEQAFVQGYESLINSIREVSPNTQIIVCSIASVSSNYQGADGLTPALVARANAWIRQVCINTGAYYADIANLLNDQNGYLSDAYLMPDGRSIAAAGIALIVDYFRFHALP